MKVVFITSYGRSGSTILDLTLNGIEGLETVGELRNIWLRLTKERTWLCGCGNALCECERWRKITRNMLDLGSYDQALEYFNLFMTVDRFRAIPMIVSNRKPKWFREKQEKYSNVLLEIYRNMLAESGSDIIIDSSKQPSYGFLLTQMKEIDLYVVHLVRDSRAVAYSWLRKKRNYYADAEKHYMDIYPLRKSAIEWNTYGLAQESLRLQCPNYLRLKYEDFAYDPQAMLAEILEFIGESGRTIKFESGNVVNLHENHTVAGNPARFQKGPITIKPDYEWKSSMKKSDRRIVTLLTLPLLARFGYLKSHSGLDD